MQKHKILSFLLALLVSIGLWFYAVTVVNPNDTARISDIKVRIVGTGELTSNNLMLTGGEGQTVTVEISGRRSDLKELNSSSLEAVADVSNIDRAGEYEVSWTLDPPSTVASGDISLVSASSNKIKVKVSEYKERPEIPITVEYVGELASGYVRDPAVLSTETLAVSGPSEEVGKIDHATVTVDLTDATKNISEDMEYRFVDKEGEELSLSEYVTVSTPTVRVTVPVLAYKQVNLKVKLIAGGGATEEDVTCTIDPPTIGVTGSEEALRDLDDIEILEIDLGKIVGSKTWTITPDLPAGVTNRATDSTIKILLRFNGLTTKSFTIPCADITRLNDDETMGFGEQSVVIQVRGRSEAVNALSAEDIKITADMKNDYDPTTKTLTLQVSLPATTTAGVIGGPYTVQIIEVVPETGD